MSFLKGDIRILSIRIEGVYVPIGCLISNDLEESVEMLDTTTRASGGWKTSIPTNQSYNIPFEGIQVVSDSTTVSYNQLKKIKRNRERIEWQISGGALETDEGFGYITNISEGNTVGELLSFSGEILGYGEPVIIEITGDLFQDGDVMLFQDGEAILFND